MDGMGKYTAPHCYARHHTLTVPGIFIAVPNLNGMFNPPFVYSLDARHDGNGFAAGLGDGSIIAVTSQDSNAAEFTSAFRSEIFESLTARCQFLPDDQHIIAASNYGSVKYLAIDAGAEQFNTKFHAELDMRVNTLELLSASDKIEYIVSGIIPKTAQPDAFNIRLYAISQ